MAPLLRFAAAAQLLRRTTARLTRLSAAVGVTLAFVATGCLMRSESDQYGNPVDSARPNPYGDDPGLAPIVGGVGSPVDGNDGTAAPVLGENANAISFVAASALFVTTTSGSNVADNANVGTTLYVYAQASSCADVTAASMARRGLVLQVQLSGPPQATTYRVMATNGDVATAEVPQGQAALTLLNGGAALLRGAQGELTLGQGTATSLEIEGATLTFAGGQQLVLEQLEAQACAATGGDAPLPDPNAPFTVANAYFAPATGTVAPILTLVDQPLSCADLRASNVGLPAGARLLRIYLGDVNYSGNYALADTNAPTGGGTTAGKAAARLLRPALTAIATGGTVTIRSYAPGSQLEGSITATFNDGFRVDGASFLASHCP